MRIENKLELLAAKYTPNILVIGDLMLDHYIFGSADRLSPEAPVPVVNVKSENKIIGGAANVANNILSLGAKVSIVGVVGNDQDGDFIQHVFKEKQIDGQYILKDTSRCTTIKTRILAANHQIARIDREDTHPINDDIAENLLAQIYKYAQEADIVIISDYNKGLLSNSFTQKILQYCNSIQKKVIVDPKGTDYSKYKLAYAIKPNRKELSEISLVKNINSLDKLKEAALKVFEITQAENLVVTLSEEGMVILTPDSVKSLPVKATEVYDVTGAGDTVIATMSYCLAIGFSLEEACEIANFAAAIVIKHVGSATTSIEEIIASIKG
ncbi:D-glycero-beta-D-manno-heptose-7-phosphate kinase [Pseudopedobacter beijingensis]|uniref:D-glycero-beta-D-manno-heptose-7-phosphate kinase n=1 Tax=Pseudopedobacter beijingensis TaxID=1207056 RepID=A0ABW4IDK2_9SPHI